MHTAESKSKSILEVSNAAPSSSSSSLNALSSVISDDATTTQHMKKRKEQPSMDEPVQPFPDISETLTKTDWNAQVKRILARNNAKKTKIQ
jgi:hypothetical protein